MELDNLEFITFLLDPVFHLAWRGNCLAENSGFVSDGYLIIDKKFLSFGHLQLLINRYGEFPVTPEERALLLWETYIPPTDKHRLAFTGNYIGNGADRAMVFKRENDKGPPYHLNLPRMATICNLILPTSLWGQDDPLKPVVFYKSGSPIALLMPMDI